MSESGPDPLADTNTFFPKVAAAPKPSTFQPSFPSHMNGGASTTTLPKLGTTSTTYLPTLQQAFVKSKPKVMYETIT